MRRFLEICDPGFLAGFRFSDWCRILAANQFDIEMRCLPRAALATVGTLATSLLRFFEARTSSAPLDEEAWEHPLFILGLSRSGTTHLFDVLTRDTTFAWPTRLDAYHPHTFLTLRQLGLATLLGAVKPQRRILDNVEVGWLTPEEDVIALQVLMGLGTGVRHLFPWRYPPDPARDASLGETPEFARALQDFTRKLVHLHCKPVLLKSPPHLNWLPDILQAFPRARFVVIFRDPVRHFASQAAALTLSGPRWSSLQSFRPWSDAERLAAVEFAFERYFGQTKALVPPGRLVEIRHEDLVADERGTLLKIREGLADSAPERLMLSVPRDTAAPKPYQPNKHPEPDKKVRRQIRHAYRRLYEGGYYD